MMAQEESELKTMRGIPASPGIIIGKAHLVDRERTKIIYQYLITDEQLDREVERFRHAVQLTENQLTTLKNKLPDHVKEHAFILDSHLMILNDKKLTDATVHRILEEKIKKHL